MLAGRGRGGKAEAKTGRTAKRNFNGTEFKHRKSSRRHPACSNYSKNAALSASLESAIWQQCTVISGRVRCGEWVAQTLARIGLSITVVRPGALLWALSQLVNPATVSPRRLQSPKLPGVKFGPTFNPVQPEQPDVLQTTSCEALPPWCLAESEKLDCKCAALLFVTLSVFYRRFFLAS